MLTDLYLDGFTIDEASGWMQDAVKHEGKLTQDLGIKKGEHVYDLPVDKVVSYAKQSPENKKRVVLAHNFYRFGNGGKNFKGDVFWARVFRELNKENS